MRKAKRRGCARTVTHWTHRCAAHAIVTSAKTQRYLNKVSPPPGAREKSARKYCTGIE